MTKLSIFINGIASLLNDDGSNFPKVAEMAADIVKYGANGITVRPDPEGIPIGYDDAARLRGTVDSTISIAGVPTDQFIRLARTIRPDRVILLPDSSDTAPNGRGWDTKHNLGYLSEICEVFNTDGIPSSILVDPDTEMVRYASETGCKFAELCTDVYPAEFSANPEQASEPYYFAVEEALKCGIGVNAWCGLSLKGLDNFHRTVPQIDTVTVGNTLIIDALHLGLENALDKYIKALMS